jgi:peptide/nickel transport system substrate-binding protein
MRDVFTIVQPSLPFGDPHICSDAKDRVNMISAVYEALVNRDGPGVYSPCLAEAWRTEREARIWDFRLRHDVFFHDGHELRASDVTASLERVRSPNVGGSWGTQGVYASYIGEADFEAIGTDRVRIILKEPMADLLDLLTEMPIVPEQILDDLPAEHIGSGPYALNDLASDKASMTRHGRHWRGKPTYKKIVWRAEPDEAERIKSVARDAEVATGLSPTGSRRVRGEGKRVEGKYGSMCVIYMLNCLSGPCRDTRVRRALNVALDRKAIIERIMLGAAEALTGPLTPLHLGWDSETPQLKHDPAEARRLLRDAGYPDGLTVKMDTPTESPDEAIPLGKLMTEQYREANIEVENRIYSDRPEYAEMVRAKKIGDLCCFDSSPLSTFRVMREKLHSGLRGPWWQGYANKEVDALIESAQRIPDAEGRGIRYRSAYRMIAADAPWIFLYRPEYSWAVAAGAEWAPSWDCVVRLH